MCAYMIDILISSWNICFYRYAYYEDYLQGLENPSKALSVGQYFEKSFLFWHVILTQIDIFQVWSQFFTPLGSQKDVRRQQNILDVNGNFLGIPPISVFGLFLSALAFGGLLLVLSNEIGMRYITFINYYNCILKSPIFNHDYQLFLSQI